MIAARHDEIASFGIVAHSLGAGMRGEFLDQGVGVRRIRVENENSAIARGDVSEARGAGGPYASRASLPSLFAVQSGCFICGCCI